MPSLPNASLFRILITVLYDNVMAENFFSILEAECIYRHKPQSFGEANEMIDRFIDFYNNERIQLKTGVAPLVSFIYALLLIARISI